MKKITFLYLFFFILSCEKGEIPISQHNSGQTNSTQINMGSDYSKQIFYKLKTNSVISENQKTEWDIAFDCSINGWNVIINSSTFSRISEISGLIPCFGE